MNLGSSKRVWEFLSENPDTIVSIKGGLAVVFPAVLGVFISVIAEYRITGGEHTTLQSMQSFLVSIFDIPLSNASAFALTTVIGVALCFIFQLKTPLAALYGGASVIAILTTGLSQHPNEMGGVVENSNFRDGPQKFVFQKASFQLTQANNRLYLLLCPDVDKPFVDKDVSVLWRTYGASQQMKKTEITATVAREGTVVPLPFDSSLNKSSSYEITVRSDNMKTIYSNGLFTPSQSTLGFKVTTEEGENNFFDWLLQMNIEVISNTTNQTCTTVS